MADDDYNPNELLDNISTSSSVFKRVLSELKVLNNDFHNLRCIVLPCSAADRINLFTFVMIPNDGPFCHVPLLGRIIIPEYYPAVPPVVHLLTRTGRFNVDIFSYNATNNSQTESSMCFDVLKSPALYKSMSAWKPSYTLSTVMGSLLQSIVSYYVEQMGGGEIAEFITMEKLQDCYNYAIAALNANKDIVPLIPRIPAVRTRLIKNNIVRLQFPDVIHADQDGKSTSCFEQTIMSGPLSLQGQHTYVAGFDLSTLSANYVLSFVITNNPRDLVGKQKDTILFRNGVTATAARRTLLMPKTIWAFSGRALKQGNLKLAITVSPSEILFAYQDLSTSGEWFVHGDVALTPLNPKVVGDLRDIPFYFVIYLKRKWGTDKLSLPNLHPKYGFAADNS
jgi:ubiquitin-protein ligase